MLVVKEDSKSTAWQGVTASNKDLVLLLSKEDRFGAPE